MSNLVAALLFIALYAGLFVGYIAVLVYFFGPVIAAALFFGSIAIRALVWGK